MLEKLSSVKKSHFHFSPVQRDLLTDNPGVDNGNFRLMRVTRGTEFCPL